MDSINRLKIAIKEYISFGTFYRIINHNYPRATIECSQTYELIRNCRIIRQRTGWIIHVEQYIGNLDEWIRTKLGPDVRFEIYFKSFPIACVSCTVPFLLRGIDNTFFKDAEQATGWQIKKVTQLALPINLFIEYIKQYVSDKIEVQEIEIISPKENTDIHGHGSAIIRCNYPKLGNNQHLINSILRSTGYIVRFLITEEQTKFLLNSLFPKENINEIRFLLNKIKLFLGGSVPSPGSYLKVINTIFDMTGYSLSIVKNAVSKKDLLQYLNELLPQYFPLELTFPSENLVVATAPSGGYLIGEGGEIARTFLWETGWKIHVVEKPLEENKAVPMIQNTLKNIFNIEDIKIVFSGIEESLSVCATIYCSNPGLMSNSDDIKLIIRKLSAFTGWSIIVKMNSQKAKELAEQYSGKLEIKRIIFPSESLMEIFCLNLDGNAAREIHMKTGWQVKLLAAKLYTDV